MAVGWYRRYWLSYRDAEELMLERGVSADHLTVWRCGQHYTPELARRQRPHLKLTNESWRVDETYSRGKGKWAYLCRVVDSSTASISFLLPAKRHAGATKRFFQQAQRSSIHPTPRVVNVDTNPSSPLVMQQLKAEGDLRPHCLLRRVQYLHNISEQDHRAIRRRVRASRGFRSFWAPCVGPKVVERSTRFGKVKRGVRAWAKLSANSSSSLDSFRRLHDPCDKIELRVPSLTKP